MNLLSWASSAAQRIGNTVNNDVIQPIQRDVIAPVQRNVVQPVQQAVQQAPQMFNRDVAQPVANFTSRAVAQVNPFDNNRTWQHQAPTNTRSILGQATHNGITNFVGNAVAKPLIRSSMALNQGIGNAEVGIAHGLGLRNDLKIQNAPQYVKSTGIPSLQQFSGYKGTKAQIGGDLAQTAINIGMPGSSKLVTGAFKSVLPEAVPAIVSRTLANSGVGAVGGAANNVASGFSNNQIHSANDLKNQALTGAQFGALLGGAGTLAAPLAKGAIKVAKNPGAAIDAVNPDKLAHTQLAKTNPGYVQLQDTLKQSTDAANKINQIGGSKVALNQHLKNIDNIQRQMADMRNTAKQVGTVNPDYSSIPVPGKLPKPTATPEVKAPTSKSAIPAPVKPFIVNGKQITPTAKDPFAFKDATTGAKTKSTPEQIGKALGMSDKQIAAAKVESKGTSVSTPTSVQKTPVQQLHSQQEGLQVPKTGNKLTSVKAESTMGGSSQNQVHQEATPKQGVSPGQQKVSPRSSDTKYTTNTTKVNVPVVNSGDYQKVRSNAQLVQSVVHNHAQGVVHAMNKIPKGELKDFWHKVEDPSLPRSTQMQEAIKRWQGLSDTVHATSTALGGDTAHLPNYARHNWDLTDPAQQDLYNKLLEQRMSSPNYDPNLFKGLDNKPRAFSTVKQGEAAGFKLKNSNPIQDVVDYANQSKRQLKTQSVAKGMQEAEINVPNSEKSTTQTIGYKKSIELSPQGQKELQSLYPSPRSTNKVVTTYRTFNRSAKQLLLSISQFHPININMQAAPALALKGHPVMAMRGLIDSAASINKKYSDNIMQNALHDGTLENAARIGTPIATGSDFGSGGAMNIKGKLGERMIFERQLPAMHVQMVHGIVSDLNKRGISLDSVEARKAGNTVNEIMGYVNTELRNLHPSVQRGLGDVMLAPQFTRSKWQVLGDAFTKGGQAGSYARSAVVGKYAAEAAITLAVGALVGQKSDNVKDVLLRTLTHPSIPTPFKDSKGNNIELGMPHNYISEAANLATTLNRGTNGRLSVGVNPGNIPGNLTNYGQGRLAMIPSDFLKLATNTNYAGKPLYDPNAPLKTQAAQGATTILSGNLPIGLQGAMYTNAVKKHLPQDIQQVLNAGTPGSNPILKSVASSFGLTARTDKTVGKGLQTNQYFTALDAAKTGLNRQEQDALDLYTGGKKNPVTGQYQIMPTANDSRVKAVALLQSPKTIDNLITMNQKLASQGQSVDPLWSQSKANITKYLQYQAMPPASADKTDWYNKNTSWYAPLQTQRNSFFNTLPAGDPNKPKLSIQYPTPPSAVQSAIDTYNGLSDATAKGNFLDNHPEIIKQWNAVSTYNNNMREAQGYAPLKGYPEPSATLNNFMNTYSSADKTTRTSIRNGNPQQYQSMIAYFDSVDMYNNNKQGAVNQLQGEPDQTSKQNKAISSLAKDIYQNPDGSYSIVPAGWMNGLSNGSGYGSSGSKSKKTAQGIAAIAQAKIKGPKLANPTKLPSLKSNSAFKAPTMRTFNYKAPKSTVAKISGVKRPSSGSKIARVKVKNNLV